MSFILPKHEQAKTCIVKLFKYCKKKYNRTADTQGNEQLKKNKEHKLNNNTDNSFNIQKPDNSVKTQSKVQKQKNYNMKCKHFTGNDL